VFVVSTVDRMGDDHDTWSMASRRARESSTTMDRRYVAALDAAGRVVGSAELTMPLRDNPTLALGDLAVAPDHRRRGTGTALVEHLVDVARCAGRTSLVLETSFRDGDADPGERFLRRRGFEVAQEDLRRDLDVTAWAGDTPLATPGYVVETSTDDTRDEWLEDRAHLQRRMSTDAPSGDLVLEEEHWDVDRLRDHRDVTRRSGRRAVESVARHVASGRLVAFSQLQVPAESPTMAYQQDTLVLREHRGHGLGLALKAATMQALVTACPEVRTVRTWNATTNGPMIAVNEALGYRTTAFLREWRRRLP
jgi:GNAT superfamily N-acetyltransferase